MLIKISRDYIVTPGGRYSDDGPFSGEEFRDSLLEPKYLESLSNNESLIVDFDDCYGFSTGFLEESFGGIVRKGYSAQELITNMEFISNEEPEIINMVIKYMEDEERRSQEVNPNSRTRNKKILEN